MSVKVVQVVLNNFLRKAYKIQQFILTHNVYIYVILHFNINCKYYKNTLVLILQLRVVTTAPFSTYNHSLYFTVQVITKMYNVASYTHIQQQRIRKGIERIRSYLYKAKIFTQIEGSIEIKITGQSTTNNISVKSLNCNRARKS